MGDNESTTPITQGCGHPGRSEFADLFYTNYSQGAQANYTCFENYLLKTGNLSRTCLPSGAWSGDVPYCSREKVISETTIAIITGALAVIVLILLPVDYVLSKRRVRRQKLWERRATKRKRKERVAAFNMIAIKHAGNLSRPPLILMQAADSSLRPVPGKYDTYKDNNAQETTTMKVATADKGRYNTNFATRDETEMQHDSDYIENGTVESPAVNPRVLPPLERKPSKRKKKKKRRRITPQSSVDVDDGGFVNSGFNNSNSNLDHCVPEYNTSNEAAYQRLQNKQNSDSSEHTLCVDIHQEDDEQIDSNLNPTFIHDDENGFALAPDRNQSIALQVGYNNLGKLATDV